MSTKRTRKKNPTPQEIQTFHFHLLWIIFSFINSLSNSSNYCFSNMENNGKQKNNKFQIYRENLLTETTVTNQ